MSRFINAEIESDLESDLEAESKSDTELMAKLESGSDSEKLICNLMFYQYISVDFERVKNLAVILLDLNKSLCC